MILKEYICQYCLLNIKFGCFLLKTWMLFNNWLDYAPVLSKENHSTGSSNPNTSNHFCNCMAQSDILMSFPLKIGERVHLSSQLRQQCHFIIIFSLVKTFVRIASDEAKHHPIELPPPLSCYSASAQYYYVLCCMWKCTYVYLLHVEMYLCVLVSCYR